MTVASESGELTISVATELGKLTLHYRIVDTIPQGVTKDEIVDSLTGCFESTARLHFKGRGDCGIITTMVSQQYAHHAKEWIKQTLFVTLDV